MSDHERNIRTHQPEQHTRNEVVHSLHLPVSGQTEEERRARNAAVHSEG